MDAGRRWWKGRERNKGGNDEVVENLSTVRWGERQGDGEEVNDGEGCE